LGAPSASFDRQGPRPSDDEFEACYINKDVLSLSEMLLRFREMIEEASELNGPGAFLDGQVPQDGVNLVRSHLQSYEAQALTKGAMWVEARLVTTEEKGLFKRCEFTLDRNGRFDANYTYE
jgi:hypothetical protein